MPPSPDCSVVNLGLMDYLEAWDLQASLARQVADGTRCSVLLLLQHPHVYTIGRRGSRDEILLDESALQRLGAPVHEVDRGGQVAYHGPGQLVAYPVLDLRGWGGPVKYVRALERSIISTLGDFGVQAQTLEGVTGVWADGLKIGAIGVKISRGVCWHGLSVNVSADLSYYDHIVPCGIPDLGVTSMEAILGDVPDIEAVAYSLSYRLGAELGFRMIASDETVEELLAGSPRPAVRSGS